MPRRWWPCEPRSPEPSLVRKRGGTGSVEAKCERFTFNREGVMLDRKAFRFFFGNAGYVVGERALCAAALTRAEERYERDPNVRFRWEPDEGADLSWMEPEEASKVNEVFGCTMETRCGSCGQWQHAESLWGVVDPDKAYMRVVQAELAAQASR